jgi:hypothetical protein
MCLFFHEIDDVHYILPILMRIYLFDALLNGETRVKIGEALIIITNIVMVIKIKRIEIPFCYWRIFKDNVEIVVR